MFRLSLYSLGGLAIITAQLTGGLGNQLFTYAEISLLARESRSTLRIDGTVVERIFGRAPDLFDLKLNEEDILLSRKTKPLASIIDRVFWKYSILRFITKKYQPKLLGSRISSIESSKYRTFRGFFQQSEVATDYLETFGNESLSLKYETPAYIGKVAELNQIPTACIHIRRGDYMSYADSFGLLDFDYYQRGLERLLQNVVFSRLWIFTDSPELVQNGPWEGRYPYEIINPNLYTPAETMHLMSKGAALVCSNSTFSFWSASLAGHKNVVVPNPWFKSNDEWLSSSSLQNSDWIQIEPMWL